MKTEKNKVPTPLANARAIKKWMEERKTTKPPAASSKNEEERKLGLALSTIRQNIMKAYKEMSEEERAEYREEHPEIDEILEIVEKIDRENESKSLLNARAIKQWMEERETTKPPSQSSKDEEERKLGVALNGIRQNIVKPYLAMTEDEKKGYKEDHPEIDEILEIIEEIDRNNVPISLANARAIKKWMEERETTKPPAARSKDEEERRLGVGLSKIRQIIKSYQAMTEKEMAAYKEKHPEIDQILAIVEEIDRKKDTVHLVKARAIKKWMEEKRITKPPSQKSKDEEEKKLGRALSNIRVQVIKPYKAMSAEKRAQYREKHPEIDEILEIIKEINRGKETAYVIHARAIKKWMEERETTKPPAERAKDEEEKRLAQALHRIKQRVIIPYNEMPEEERAEYREEHPEIDEILLIISEIDEKRGKKAVGLELLVEEARERMEMLKQAKELEAIYEEYLGKKAKEDKIGVDIK